MKSKQTMPVMIALAAIVAVALSPLALAEEDVPVAIQDVAADTPQRPQVHFYGDTNGWAIIGGQAHEAKIGIDGNAVRADNGVWRVTSEADITAGDRHATLELKGKAVNGKIKLHGSGTLDSGESFRIILRGHYAPVYEEQGTFVMAFKMAKIHSMENQIHIPLIQSGIVNVEAVDPTTDDYSKFLEEIKRD